MKNIIAIFTGLVLLTGCANNFATHYTSIASVNTPSYIPTNKPIEIIDIGENPDELNQFLRVGYLPVGKSNFIAQSRSQKTANIEIQAKAVGAQIVLLNRKDAGTSTTVLPMTTPVNSVSTTNSNHNIYGNNVGLGNIYGTSTTTTYGSKTQYIPVTSSFTEYTATYLAKFKSRVGIHPAELTDLDKQALDQNTGIRVKIVVDGSPAYFGNIIPNDLILRVNGQPVAGVNGFAEISNNLPAGRAKFEILRNNKVVTKEIEIN